MRVLSKFGTAAAVAAMLAWSSTASAASLQVVNFPGNECGGGAFGDCSIDGSPVVIKFDANGSVDDINNGDFATIDGSEFTFLPPLSGSLTEGQFSYNPNDADDPEIRFWVAKGGNSYNLHYWGDAGDLSSAMPITHGQLYNWYSPTGSQISHISFFDTEGGGGGGDTQVPEPASLILFGLGTLAAGYRARRRFTV